jgi:adenylosuccinate synthase
MSKIPNVTAVVGGQWGDEGKGKIVDYLATEAQVVIRAQGGDNAGHTIRNEKGKFALHLIPAGIFNPDSLNIIGAGTALNPKTILEELASLEERNVDTKNLVIDPKAHLAFDYHQVLDGHHEESLGDYKIGTTKRGIGPTYMDRVERIGLPARLLLDTDAALKHLDSVLQRKRAMFPSLADRDELQASYYDDLLRETKNRLQDVIKPVTELISQKLQDGQSFLVEGAQGALLDINHGTYPRVTSSNTIVAGLLAGSGIPPRYLTKAVGVFKAYESRVGEGGMPTELLDDMGHKLREAGHEYGTTTGRPRRVGWFDGPAARYAQAINGFTDIALTRVDTLANFEEIKLATSYEGNEPFSPDDSHLLEQKPVYQTFEGWSDFKATNFDELPESAQKYCRAIEDLFIDAKLSFIGTGESREDLIIL